MINISELLKSARKNLKRKYIKNIFVSFIISLILFGSSAYNLNREFVYNAFNSNSIGYVNNTSNYDVIVNTFYRIMRKNNSNYSRGFLALAVDLTTKDQSFVFGIINAVNESFLQGSISNRVITIVCIILAFIFYFMIRNPMIVGSHRYYLEERRYKVKIYKIFFAFKYKKVLHISYILFVKTIYQLLWNLTIVGGIIKHYEYKMIPYILAENPNVSLRDAFMLSKCMMDGEKLNAFKLDLRLLIWYVLDYFTYKLVSIFFFDAYKESIFSEYYMRVRSKAKDKYKYLLCDNNLDIEEYKDEYYPENEYFIKNKHHVILNYNTNYSILDLILMFFMASFGGWLWEVFFNYINYGGFVNRGSLHGPWLPLYGFGSIIVLLVLRKYRDDYVKQFMGSLILCGSLEYFTGLYLETVMHLRWWDYDYYFLNIGGKVCLESLLLFGFGGCLLVYVLAPIWELIFSHIKPYVKVAICYTLGILFLSDIVISYKYPNVGEGITTEVLPN
ncbi:MAG TPA: DUF975 family protein [Bacilli bacterium]|nr:DUF975 family protein [Bacilli bacterium]